MPPLTFFQQPQYLTLTWQTQARLCAFWTILGLNQGTTRVLKFFVQRRRPNFYAYCGFDVAQKQCTASVSHIQDAQFSFPSGHSSLSMCASTFLVGWWLSMLWASSRSNTKTSTPLSRWQLQAFFICLLPWAWALWVACTRVVDYWHHPSDIVAGLCLGFGSAMIGYHLWFPPLTASSNPSLPWALQLDSSSGEVVASVSQSRASSFYE